MLGEETVLLKALDGKRGQPEQRPPHPADARLPTMPRRSSRTCRPSPPCPGSCATAPRPSRRSAPGDARARSSSSVRGAGRRRRRRGAARARRCARSWRLGGKPGAGRTLKAVARRRPDRRPPAAGPARHAVHVRRPPRRRRPRRLGLGDRRRRPRLHRRPGAAPDPLLRRRGVRQDDPLPDRHCGGSPRSASGSSTAGRARRDLDAARRTSRPTSSASALCDHERLATLPLMSGMRYFRDELDEHILRGECPAGVCRPIAVAADRLIERPLSAPDGPHGPTCITPPRHARPEPRSEPADADAAEIRSADARCLTTQAPQRPQVRRRAIRIEVDGRVVEGLEGQTILEVCRDNGIEIPTLCYEPKLPGFGACRMCVVEVEGEEHPPISCSRDVRSRDEGPDPDRGDPPPAPDEPRADLQRPQRLLPAALPEQVPEPHRHPGLPQANAEGNLRESTRIFKRTIPFPIGARAGLPGAVRGALPARRGRRGDRDPRLPPLRRRHGHQVDARRGPRPAGPVRAPGRDRPARGRDRLRARRAWPRPTTCCSPATTSPSSSATRRPAGCSATASRSTACPRSRSSRPSTRA